MENDAISRSELLKLFPVNLDAPFWHVTGIRAAIGSVDALDVVPVVRCKDCWKRGGYQCPMFYEELESYDEGAYEWIAHDNTERNGFCDRGERMDGESK